MNSPVSLRLGTRASPLALWQANWVAQRLRQVGAQVDLLHISTQGDQQQQGPIGQMGGQGVFTKEIQRALLDGRIDLAVHSLKDLPTEPVVGLMLAAVPPRGPQGDVLVSPRFATWDALPERAVVGTGSSRRRAQLWHARPDLAIQDVRGNVETRLRKLREGQYDALILAEAGLVRLELATEIRQVLPKSLLLPAVGQGALGLECREDDLATRQWLSHLDDAATHSAVLAERVLLATLRGGCLAPVGAWGRLEADGQLHLTATVLSSDGRHRLLAQSAAVPSQAAALGAEVAQALLQQGAAELLEQARSSN